MVDLKGIQCPVCKNGTVNEQSMYNDWDGTVTCSSCKVTINSKIDPDDLEYGLSLSTEKRRWIWFTTLKYT